MAKTITVTGFEGATKGTLQHGMKKQVFKANKEVTFSTRNGGLCSCVLSLVCVPSLVVVMYWIGY